MLSKTIIITGSSGLVGSTVVNFFIKKKFNVIGIDNNYRKKFFGSKACTIWVRKKLNKIKKYKHYNINICSFKNLEVLFKKNKNISGIVHCAAQPSHDWPIKSPFLDFDVNAKATLNLLELSRKYFLNKPFIFLSTNKVYGDKINSYKFLETNTRYSIINKKISKNGVDEQFGIDQTKHSLFGCSKLAADLLVQEYGKYFNMKTVCLRAGCITGPMHSGVENHGFLSHLVKTYVSNKIYTIFGYKGKQVRDNLHSEDLASLIWEVFQKPKSGEIYNVGGGIFSNCSVLEAIKLCEKIGKKKFYFKIVRQNRKGDHKWWISDCSKLKKDYPKWIQKYNTYKIILDIYNYVNKIKKTI
jgi:CDP-paratose 2-epimerase